MFYICALRLAPKAIPRQAIRASGPPIRIIHALSGVENLCGDERLRGAR
jgi:hypothetical protein